MKAMFDLYVMSNLKNRTSQLVISRYFNICDFGESMVEEMILDLVNHQTNPTIATYAKPGEVLVRITANGTDAAAINGLLDKYSKEMDRRFGRHIFAHAQKTLAETVGDLLLKKHSSRRSTSSMAGTRSRHYEGFPWISTPARWWACSDQMAPGRPLSSGF